MAFIFNALSGQFDAVPPGQTLRFPGILSIASGKTFTVSNTLTLAGTDSTTMTFPTTSATMARTDAANAFTGASTGTNWNLTTPTFTTSATGPLFIGGTTTTSTLTLRSTSGSGTTGADIIFQTGNNGANERMRILNSGFVGIGVSPSFPFQVVSSFAGVMASFDSSDGTYGAQFQLNSTNGGRKYILVSIMSGVTGGFGIFDATAGAYRMILSQTGNFGFGITTTPDKLLTLASTGSIGWDNGSGAADVLLSRAATSNLLLSNATTATRFDIANTITTVATAGEWAKFGWASNQFRFGAAAGSSSGTNRAASWDYGDKIASATAAITVPATSGNIVFGGGVQLSNAAVTGLVAGAVAALTTATIVLYDSTGQAYRVPCVI